MDHATTLEIVGSLEKLALLSLSVHEHLAMEGQTTHAREVLVLHLEASGAAEKLGKAIGIEVTVE